MTTRTSPRAARWTLVTHTNPDIDDIEAFRILMHHGNHRYEGIVSAEIVTVSDRKPWDKDARELEKEGYLCVGIAGGRFDEHAFDGRPRKQDECAATLVAKHLGLFDHPKLQKNLEYAFDRNQNANSTHFDLSLLAKLAFRYLTHTGDEKRDKSMVEKIFQSAFMFLNAAEDNEAGRVSGEEPKGSVVRSMDDYIGVWLLRKFRKGKPAMISDFVDTARMAGKSVSRTIAESLELDKDDSLRHIIAYADSHQSPDSGNRETKFGLAELIEIAQRHHCVGETASQMRGKIGDAAGIFITGMWQKELGFLKCRDDFASKETNITMVRYGREMIKIASVVSDNPEISKYCRSKEGGRAKVIIQRHPKTGNTQIFFDQSARIDPRPIVAAIRAAERRANGIFEEMSFERLTAHGEVAGAMNWYFDGHQIMNGSLTTNRPPTKLSRALIENAVARALKM